MNLKVLLASFTIIVSSVVGEDVACSDSDECFARGVSLGFNGGFYSAQGGDEYPTKGG